MPKPKRSKQPKGWQADINDLMYWHPMTEEERMQEAMREFIEAIKKSKNKHRTKS